MTNKITLDLQKGFGFDPDESMHHFIITIPRGSIGEIQISEHFTWDPEVGSSAVSLGAQLDGQVRSILARAKWDDIADEVRAEMNLRLRRMGRKPGSWKVGANLVRRELGKELTLLAWAIEDADPSLIPTAIANWSGLEPEERWWLYTQTAAATGHGINDRNKGWRKAVRYALTENPITSAKSGEALVPEYFRQAAAGPLFKTIGVDEAEQDDSS